MKKKISTKQITYSIGAFIISSSLLLRELYQYLVQDTWIGILLGILISMPIFWIYGSIAKRFPAMCLMEINDAVFGKLLGKLISALYFFYFLSLSILNLRDLGDFVKGVILPKTPMAITLIMFLLICAWALRKGMGKIVRCSFLLVFATVIMLLINALLLINQMKWEHFLPMFTMPPENYLIGAHITAMLPVCEIFVFFALLPDMQKPEEFGKSLRYGLVIGAVALLSVSLRDIAVMGHFVQVSTLPSYSVLRLINIGGILTRLEIVYAVVLISLLFFKISIIYYAAVSSFSRLLGFRSYRFLILIFGALTVVYAMAVFDSSFEHIEWMRSAGATYAAFFLAILPALTLITAVIRKRPGEKEQNPA